MTTEFQPMDAMEQIRQQKARYCRFLDTRQFDEWERVFAPHASVAFHDPDGALMFGFDSIAELSAMTRKLFSTIRTVHQTHNSEISFDSPTRATAVWAMEDWHVHPADAADPAAPRRTMHGYGFYHEQWECLDGTWRLARMELRRSVVFET